MPFPQTRGRRLRATATVRDLIAETCLSAHDFILPLFIDARLTNPEEIVAMPGQYRWSPNSIAEQATHLAEEGLRSVLLFGLPEWKDASGSASWQADGVVQEAIRAIKARVPEMLVITDVCLCEYTDHGHCGLLRGETVDNDPTLDLLAKQALSHVEAGADIVAPSDMMDGRVAALRTLLDASHYQDIPILSYAAKYASGFYGPFREAADSAPAFGDRRSYQMDHRNGREALREIDEDIAEGADMVMVKPALAYLDVIRAVREHCHLPVVAYNVSGEYTMVKVAAKAGYIEERRVVGEILHGIKRAGADLIITYHAVEALQWLRDGLL